MHDYIACPTEKPTNSSNPNHPATQKTKQLLFRRGACMQTTHLQVYLHNIQTDRNTDRQADRQTNRQTDRQTDRKTDRQTDRQTERQAGRQTDRQAGRQTDR